MKTTSDPNDNNSQGKKWRGSDMKQLKHQKLGEAKGRQSKYGHWREKASGKRIESGRKESEAEQRAEGAKKFKTRRTKRKMKEKKKEVGRDSRK